MRLGLAKLILAPILAALFACGMLAFANAPSVRADEFHSDGVKIHYTVQGKGDPVILIHGLYSNARMNWDMPGITADLARHYQVITLDCRGHGQSDKPEAEGEYGAKMAEDVVRLMDHLHISKANVVGYSMGGMITMKLLTLHPGRIKSAVLGGMGWHKAEAPVNRFWEVAKGRGRINVPAACLHGFPALAVTEEEVKSVKVPVTIIVGDRDPCRRMYVEPLRRVRPDWPEHIIQGAGHLNCLVKPDFQAQLNAALDSSGGTKSN
jgi:pimeloyl-ACP methyl ester carboxylesterase